MRISFRTSAGALAALAAFIAPACIGDRAYTASTEPTETTFSYTGTPKAGSTVNLKALAYPTDGGGTVRFAMDGSLFPAAPPWASAPAAVWPGRRSAA